MAISDAIDHNAILAALKASPPYSDPFIFEKAKPFIADLVKVIGTDRLDDKVTVRNFFEVIADMAQLVRLDRTGASFGHMELSETDFHREIDRIVGEWRSIAADPSEFIVRQTETQAQPPDKLKLLGLLIAKVEYQAFTFRQILLRQPGIFLPQPFL